jgi:hypothetical protein
MSLTVFAGNIAGATSVPRLPDALGHAHAGVLTEAYHFAHSPAGYRLVRGTDGLSAKQARKLGSEAHDVAVLVRDGVRVRRVRVKKMTKPWWGPFTKKRREARRYLVVVLEVEQPDGTWRRWPMLAVHFEPGGPSGGIKTRGRNKGAWHDSARRSKRWLRLRKRAVLVGDENAKRADIVKHVAPKGAHVVTISGVDGAVAVGASITARRLDAPAGMHGWGTYTFKETR